MLDLPKSTEVRRQLPKTQLYKQFDWKPSQRDRFDSDVAHLDFVNWISPRTVPSIAEGEGIKEIFVIAVTLKKRGFDKNNIILLSKNIPQQVIYLLLFGDEAMLAVYHAKLFTTPWQPVETASLPLSGLNLDAVWQNIVAAIGKVEIAEGNTLSEQIRVDGNRAKLLRQIEMLERQMRTAAQPRRLRELYSEIIRLKNKTPQQ